MTGSGAAAKCNPMFSVVIPAHNEELVIRRCLDALLRDASPGELDIIVVANGCTDRTGQISKSYESRGVRVIDIEVASKHLALNAGDAAARCFPRVYLDADIITTVAAIRAVADEMDCAGALVGAPKASLDLEGCAGVVRSFYRVWNELPWCTDNPIGSGMYILSKAGHERLGTFPDITNDDQYVHDLFTSRERVCVTAQKFIIKPPRNIGGLIRRRTRTLAGQRELTQRFGRLPGRSPRLGMSKLLRTKPGRAGDILIFVGVSVMAAHFAARKLRRKVEVWERDDTSRAPALVSAENHRSL